MFATKYCFSTGAAACQDFGPRACFLVLSHGRFYAHDISHF
jgi:hypothetical protein